MKLSPRLKGPEYQVFTLPPSTASVCPVTKSLSADDRKTSAPRRSWGCSSRRSERDWTARSRAVSTWPGFSRITVSLKVKPGASVLTRMPCSPSSRASARERHDAALAGDVVQHPRDAAKGGARADIDDLAVALGDHVRGDVFDHQKRPAQIDRHHLVPQLGVDLGTLGFLQRREQRGVVHQHVDLAEALDGGCDQRPDRSFVADVGDGAGHRIGPV